MSRSFLVPILLPADPTLALQAATKQYVDATAGGTGNVMSFGFNATTTEPPTGNQVRLNNSTQTAATLVWISQTTWDGMDVTVGLGRILAGYQLYFQDFNDSTKWLLFNVTAAGTDKGVYWEFPIVYNSGPGGIPAAKMAAQSISPASHGLPSGGADGDVLTKQSSSDYAAAWEAPTGGGGGDPPVGTKMTALTALTGVAATSNDLVEVVDVSDTTMAASGTNKKMLLVELLTYVINNFAVNDGDYGDISVTAGEWLINNDSVTNAHLTNMVQATIKGRTAGAGTGDPVDLTAAQVKTILVITGADIATDSVTNTQLAPMATLTMKGNATGSTAGPTDLTVAAVKTMLGIDNITVSSTAPSSPAVNDLWVDTT